MTELEITEIKQGDEIWERNGRQILGQGLRLKGSIHNNSSLEPVVIKMMAIQSKNEVDDPATSAKMFLQHKHAETHQSFADIGGMRAMFYDIDRSKYTVLGSKQWTLDAQPNPNTAEDGARFGGKGCIWFFNKYIPLKGKKINFEKDTISSCINKIFIVWMVVQADNDQVVGDKIERNVVGTLTYKDF